MSFPIQLTVLRIVLVPVFFILFAVLTPPETGWAVVVFVVAAASDWWDGYIARAMKMTTALGAFLDPLADKLLTGSAFIAFAMRGYIPWWMAVLIISRDIYLTLFRMASDGSGLSLKTSYFAKVKTFVQMTFIAFLLAALVAQQGTLGIALVHVSSYVLLPDALYWSMSLVTMLTVASAVTYSYDNWPVLRSAGMRYLLRRSPNVMKRAPSETI
ncbi:MAG TPA: CDP-diacylglycerol--glycerol-3-phosphate 3-phosphatidyltransferase [Candidatus Kapabacteria bacterium]|jgi:CDP-diacylglycerol--glycerol-3-phosphate 3-phosphatidyltransferase|nr:CDP-diacylglycerol--glycerol-3-phosphate 3-phosphatidyltransferase [Candidatus Kapabacteria bacterium]